MLSYIKQPFRDHLLFNPSTQKPYCKLINDEKFWSRYSVSTMTPCRSMGLIYLTTERSGTQKVLCISPKFEHDHLLLKGLLLVCSLQVMASFTSFFFTHCIPRFWKLRAKFSVRPKLRQKPQRFTVNTFSFTDVVIYDLLCMSTNVQFLWRITISLFNFT